MFSEKKSVCKEMQLKNCYRELTPENIELKKVKREMSTHNGTYLN